MRSARFFVVFMCLMAAVNFTSADNIQGINIDFVNIGNPGNPADTGFRTNYGASQGTPYSCGAVSYNYRIGKYEVTNAQWNAFTDAAGAPTGNDGGYSYSSYWTGAQQPTNNISLYEAAQFCNYLTSGDKSKGAYRFSGNNANPGDFLGIDRVSSISTYGTTYVIPTDDEWYKAAYYKPDGSGYSLFANGTNVKPARGIDANYDVYQPQCPWDVGTGTQEQNGTYDMMGNITEWTENTGYKGGTYIYNGDRSGQSLMSSDFEYMSSFVPERDNLGFRIAEIPEPTTLLLLGLGGFILRRNKK